jgi:allantoate deiminase
VAGASDNLVATIGQIRALPGAANVIPGAAEFTLDLRHPVDAVRLKALADIEHCFEDIAGRRGLNFDVLRYYEAPACPCDAGLRMALRRTLERLGVEPFELPSGAGHDAMVLTGLCPLAMLFVRCRHGISHNPLEAILESDAEIATRALIDFIENFGDH